MDNPAPVPVAERTGTPKIACNACPLSKVGAGPFRDVALQNGLWRLRIRLERETSDWVDLKGDSKAAASRLSGYAKTAGAGKEVDHGGHGG